MTNTLPEQRAEQSAQNDILGQLARLQNAFKVPEEEAGKERRRATRTKATDAQQQRHLACFHELIRALKWPGDQLQMAENLPSGADLGDISEYCGALTKLGYEISSHLTVLEDLEDDDFPCLVKYKGAIFALLEHTDDGVLAFNSQTGEMATLASNIKRQVFIPYHIDPAEEARDVGNSSWIGVLVSRFRSLIIKLFALTLFTNLTALAVPLFVMTVYDKAIGTRSTETLTYLIIAIVIILITELGLRSIRGRALAYLGTRFETLTSSKAFEQLLYLPLPAVEDAPISAQMTRLRQFENVRDFFSGSMAHAFLDMPFILVFMVTIGVIGGPLVFVPIGLIVVFAIMAITVVPINRRRLALTGQSRQAIQSFHLEAVTKHRVVKENGAQDVWLGRYSDLVKLSAVRHFRSEQLNLLVMTLTQLLIACGGTLTLYLGAAMVIKGNLTIGALIATMALVWRVMAPIQASFLSLSRVSQVIHAFRQINHLMAAALEREPRTVPILARKYRGAVTLKRISFRHAKSADPALAGVNMKIEPGQTVVVTGPSGSGKSVLLKLLCGLYQSGSGSVLIDGVDLRHADPAEYRRVVGYVGEMFDFFPGTIEENLVMANPTATEYQLREAWRDAGLDSCASSFPDGLDTYFTKTELEELDGGIRQRLLLARVYVKAPVLYLLDKPEAGLDPAGSTALKRKLASLKG
ncbi:MAG: ATP-binding cassette domain-containing protein, partial [Rhizobiales bacterium]|nr:ATP-binding cassette domain-containing protein [Hyphomicrobiales bacterium]